MGKKSLAYILVGILAVTNIFGFYGKKDYISATVKQTPLEIHGKLSVVGTDIVDKNGDKFQLRGVSTHGINWDVGYPFVNQSAFETLRDDWKVNAVRLALYTSEYNGYCTGGNQQQLKNTLYNGVDYATNLGMYAIIDWHILKDNNPKIHMEQAKVFFNEVSSRYKNHDNIIYEICNEPNNCSWQDIKDYANTIIPIIRNNDPDAIIIVGTPTWSQLGTQGHTYEVADSPLQGYTNIMYALHFYAAEASHSKYLRTKLENTVKRGIPVIVSEFGLSPASGNGNLDLQSASTWLDLMDSLNVSYFVWSLSNKNESSALIASSTKKTSWWSDGELSEAGRWIKNAYNIRHNNEEQDGIINNPDVSNIIASNVDISYSTHIQNIGWQNPVKNGKLSGTSGRSLRLEGIKINISGDSNLGVSYQTHVQDFGWQNYASNGEMAGTSGQSKRLEAIRIKLTGENAFKYDIYYRVHVQDIGWLGWAKNNEAAGSEGYSKRLEGINIIVVPKNKDTGLDTKGGFVSENAGNINYRTHVQNVGWLYYMADGAMSGTTGRSLRLEGINIKLAEGLKGNVKYQTHVQNIGWQDFAYNGGLSGTSGMSLRLEAIKILLEGEVSNNFDIYYRVHVQDHGWLDWAKNGQMAGTSGMSKRLEGIEVVMVPKNSSAPGKITMPFIEK